jgi:hypothetical protein
MTGRSRHVRMADIVGSRVLDAEGKSRGHVIDLEVSSAMKVQSIAVGTRAWMHRLHLHHVFAPHDSDEIAWSQVESFERGVVRLKKAERDR